MKRIVFLLCIITALPASTVRPEDGSSEQVKPIRYRDADGDGKNDLFRDADGDGKNDVTGREYPHTFRFRDANGDGKNDLFLDADGDGINDLAAKKGKDREQGRQGRLPDRDNDGPAGDTGRKNTPGNAPKRFIDENADGLRDVPVSRTPVKARGEGRPVDRFSDGDGDGINDGRGLGVNNRERLREMEERGLRNSDRRPGRKR